MYLSTLLLGLLVVGLVSLYTTLLVLKYTRPSVIQGLSPKKGYLHTPTKVGESGLMRDNFLAPAAASLSVYLYIKNPNKTSAIGSSIDPIRIFQLGNTLQLQMLPAGASSKPVTQLAIRTQGPDTQPEILRIQDFPLQKWVHFVLIREGRRYTVYYNGQVVANARTQYFPVINSSQWVIGDVRITGTFTDPKVAPTVLREEEVKTELESTSNSRHVPYSDPSTSISVSWLSFGCPNGLFCFSTSGQPITDPLVEWKSPYA